MTTAREQTLRLAELLRKEHHALAEFLVALAAFDAARGWIDLGYRSLFDFLLRELRLPKGPAHYRMTAAGLIQRYPELVEPLRDGRLNLTSVTQLAKVITPENRAEILPRFFHLSKSEAKEVVAEIAPAAAPPVRTVVTAERAAAPVASAAAHALSVLVLPEEPHACQPDVPGGVSPRHLRARSRGRSSRSPRGCSDEGCSGRGVAATRDTPQPPRPGPRLAGGLGA